MIVLVIVLILMSAIFSGLTIGMFSIGLSELERKMKEGNKDAEKIYSIRKNSNFLLCTLLLGNVAVNAAISTVMSDLMSGLIAASISTGVIFIFGEVFPQALFSRHAFKVGAKTAWLVKIFMFLMYPIAKPLSMLLDWIFGKELSHRLNKRELESFLEDHVENSIDSDEKRIMVGAMKFSDKKAIDVITPSTILFAIESSKLLTEEVIDKIKDEHYSRIPIYNEEKENIIGILYAKDLLGYKTDSNKKVEDLCRKENILFIDEGYKLDSLLNHMIQTKVHMSFVFNEFGSLTGIVTLEDIIEEILKVEIMDENDTVADLQNLAKNTNRNVIIKE
ncbi:MAG: hemolysin family protein [Nanoarchaeota archaeon]